MKLNLLPLAAVAGTLMLSACATDGYYAREDAYYPERDARYVDRYDDRRYDDRRYDDRYARCFDCGRVERIERTDGDGRTSGAGAVAGAVVGGLVGNQIGSGSGRTAATVGGAVLGGIAGNEIEENANEGRYDIYIRMNDGRRVVVSQRDLNGVREGSPVRVEGGRARLI